MHEVFLRKAIDIAYKGKYLTKPNPLVGCVIVKDKKVIATANNWIRYTENEEVRVKNLALRREFIKNS